MTNRKYPTFLLILGLALAATGWAGEAAPRRVGPYGRPGVARVKPEAGKPVKADAGATTAPARAVTPRELLEKWGVEVVAIRQTAGGRMLDFRWRVREPEKARPLFDTAVKPYVLDQKSGVKFVVPAPPKLGPLRTTKTVIKDRIYFMLFANPHRFIHKGDKVTVAVGDFRAADLMVE